MSKQRRAAPISEKEHPFGAKMGDKAMKLCLSNEGLHPSLEYDTPSGLRYGEDYFSGLRFYGKLCYNNDIIKRNSIDILKIILITGR